MSICRYLLAVVSASSLICTSIAHAQPDCSGVTPIYTIQGASHVSTLTDERIETCGVVTAVAFSGYYLQDAQGDDNTETSDAIYVSQRNDKPEIGDFIKVSANVAELIGGGADSGNLSVTTLTDAQVSESTPGTTLPTPVLIGSNGRIPPNEIVISNNEIVDGINLQNAEDAAATTFNPAIDGIDFYESLEGMRVSVDDAVAVSGIRQFGNFSAEVFVLANSGDDASPPDARTRRGGITLQSDPDNRGDQNPERIQIQFDSNLFGSTDYPAIKVGDTLPSVTGVMGYSFGNFEISAVGEVEVIDNGLDPDTVSFAPSNDTMTLASYNLLNLSGADADNEQRALIASQIVNNLRQPDIIALQEVQDNNGDVSDCPRDDASACSDVLDASLTLQRLADAIRNAGGIDYEWFTVDPLIETTDDNRDDADTFGGAALGNIRNAFLYNPARLTLVFGEGISREVLQRNGVSVPTAFDTSRDPLEATFEFNGEQITIFNNHFSSRFGSTPIFGGPQPFVQAGEDNRAAQSLAMNQLVESILEKNANAFVVVLGDLNTFEFTDELAEILPAAGGQKVLHNLADIADENSYSYIFEGNSQILDHIFVSPALLEKTAAVDYVNVNADFPRLSSSIVASDHEPVVAALSFGEQTGVDLQLRSAVYSGTAVELFWNRLERVQRYDVYRDGIRLGTSDGLSYFDDSLQPGSEYVYTVEAYADGVLQVTQNVTVRTDSVPVDFEPPLELLLSSAVYSSTAVELFWERSARMQRYTVYRNGDLLVETDAISYFDNTLQADTEYVYTVQGYFNDELQASTDIIVRTIAANQPEPSAFEQVSSSVYSSTAIELFWSLSGLVQTPQRFDIFRNGDLIAKTNGRSFFDFDLQPGTNYRYSVVPVSADEVSGPAADIELTTNEF